MLRKGSNCEGYHHYYCVEVVGVPNTGKVHVLSICTACGNFQANEVQVGAPGDTLHLYREERER